MSESTARKDVADNEAVLVTLESQEWVKSRRLTRIWERVKDKRIEEDVQFLDEYTSTLNDNPSFFVTNPYAGDKRYDGEWALQTNAMSDGDYGDAPQGIVQVLQEVFTVCDITALMGLGTRRVINSEVQNLLGFGEGTQDTILLEIPFLKPTRENEDVCMRVITEAELADAFIDAGYSFGSRRWEENQESHTASLFLMARRAGFRRWRPDGIHRSPDLEESSRMDHLFSGRTRTWFGIAKADRAAVLSDLETDTGRIGAPEDFHVVSASVNNNNDGSITAQQIIQEVELEDEHIVAETKEVPHDFQYGVSTRLTVLLINFDEDELAEYTPSTPDGYLLIADETTPNGTTGQHDRTLIYEYVTWKAWGHDAYAYDTIEYSGVYSTEGNERATKTWIGIQNADMAAAVADLKTGARSTAGYSLASINLSNRRNGAFDISVVEREQQTAADDHTSKEVLDALGWPHCYGTLRTVSITFGGFSTPALAQAAATAALTTPEGTQTFDGLDHTFTGYTESEAGDGLHGVEYRYQHVLWSNDSATPMYKTVDHGLHVDGLDHSEEKQACAVGADNIDAAFDGVDVDNHPSDETDRVFVIQGKRISPASNGEFRVIFNERTASTGAGSDDAEVGSFRISFNDRQVRVSGSRVWYRRTEATKAALITPNGAGEARASTFTIAGARYPPGSGNDLVFKDSGFDVTDHHDTTYTIVQHGYAWGWALPAPPGNADNDDDEGWILIKRFWDDYRTTLANDPYNDGVVNAGDWNRAVVSVWRKRFADYETAWLNCQVYASPDAARPQPPKQSPPVGPIYSKEGMLVIDADPFNTTTDDVTANPQRKTLGYVTYDANTGMYESHRVLYTLLFPAAP